MEKTAANEKPVNKKRNTILFMAGAVASCVLITVTVFALLFIVTVYINTVTGEEYFMILLPASFALSITAGFFIYNGILKIIFKKINIDDYFDPVELKWRKPENQ